VSENSRVGIDIRSSYDGKGVGAARNDLARVDGAVQSTARHVEDAAESNAHLRQEFEQIGRQLARGDFDRAAASAARLTASLSLGAAAGGALGLTIVGIAASNERFERSLSVVATQLSTVGREAGLTRDEIGAMVRDLERMPGLSREDAFGIVGSVGGTGLNEDLFRRITQLAQDMATVTGVTVPKAAAQLGDAMRDPANGVELLADKLGILSHEQYLSAQRFIEQGDKAKAAAVLMGALEESIRGATDRAMTPMQRSTAALGQSWDGLMQEMGKHVTLDRAASLFAGIASSLKWIADNGARALAAMGMGDETDPRAKKATARAATDTRWQRQQINRSKAEAERDKERDEENKRLEAWVVDQQRKLAAEAKRRKERDLADYVSTSQRVQQGEEQFQRDLAEAQSLNRDKTRQRNERRDVLAAQFEESHGPDSSLGMTVEDLEEWRTGLLKGIDALTEIEERNARATAGFDEQGRALTKVTDQYADLRYAIDGWGRNTSQELARMAVEGEISLGRLGDAAQRLLQDIIAINIQRNFVDPIVKNGADWLGGLLGMGKSTPAAVEHAGGIVGEAGPTRAVSAALFSGARRYHAGGLVGDEVPIIARRGEGVFTQAQMRAMGQSSVRVEIVNQGTPQQVVSAVPQIDVEGTVVRIVLKDLVQGGPIRATLGSLGQGG